MQPSLQRRLTAWATILASLASAAGMLGWAAPARAGGTHHQFELGRLELESGAALPNAKLSYVTHGKLNAEKSNAILLPSFYGGDHHGYDFLIGPGKALDPEKYFIIATDLFGNGQSSSPNNTPAPFAGANFPRTTIRDNVNAGHRLLTGHFGIQRLKAIVGFSMGAQQAFQWAVSHPGFMETLIPYCGTAKEYPHGVVRLEGFKSAIMADSAYAGGNYIEPPVKGLKASGRHWAGWGFSQEWYRQELFRKFGHLSVEEHLQNFWEAFFSAQDANNLISQAVTWQSNNVGDTPGFGGDHEKALRAIKARVIYMPCQTDLYFPPQYAQYETQFIAGVKLIPIPSIWGHIAGLGINAADNEFINRTILEHLR